MCVICWLIVFPFRAHGEAFNCKGFRVYLSALIFHSACGLLSWCNWISSGIGGGGGGFREWGVFFFRGGVSIALDGQLIYLSYVLILSMG